MPKCGSLKVDHIMLDAKVDAVSQIKMLDADFPKFESHLGKPASNIPALISTKLSVVYAPPCIPTRILEI